MREAALNKLQLCLDQQTAVLVTTVVTQDGRSMEFFSKHSSLDFLVDITSLFSSMKLDFEYK